LPHQDYAFLQINDLIDSGQLAMVRWIALGGQLLTVMVIYLALDFDIPIFWLLLIIMISGGCWCLALSV
jgi:hypothetical protein